ncbi:DNA-binding transcriptional MerR regulator [Paraburkholderia sp. GAS33]|jgi:hypothetical protein
MIETADRTSPTGFDVKTVRLYETIALLRQHQRCKRTGTVGYNVQTFLIRSIIRSSNAR